MSALPVVTPLESHDDLAGELGVREFLIKRDDLHPFFGGGTKARKALSIINLPAAASADRWIVSGGAHSNHIRVVAAAAAAAHKHCTAVVFGDGRVADSPNLRLARWAGATIIYRTAATVIDEQRALRIVAREAMAVGESIHVVPASSSDDVVCYRKAGEELRSQLSGPAVIAIAAGTGATAAGIIAGLGGACPHKCILVSVHLTAPALEQACVRHWRTIAFVPPRDLVLSYDDRYVAPGYGYSSKASISATKWGAARGLLVDPIYSGRALAAVLDLARDQQDSQSESIVFWHTGGTTITPSFDADCSPTLTG